MTARVPRDGSQLQSQRPERKLRQEDEFKANLGDTMNLRTWVSLNNALRQRQTKGQRQRDIWGWGKRPMAWYPRVKWDKENDVKKERGGLPCWDKILPPASSLI